MFASELITLANFEDIGYVFENISSMESFVTLSPAAKPHLFKMMVFIDCAMNNTNITTENALSASKTKFFTYLDTPVSLYDSVIIKDHGDISLNPYRVTEGKLSHLIQTKDNCASELFNLE